MNTHQHVVQALIEAPLTAAEVFASTEVFEDRQAASRAIYEAKRSGYIEESGERVISHPGQGRREVSTYTPTNAGRALLEDRPATDDPIMAAITAPVAPPSIIPEAAMHAARLRALAAYGAVQEPVRDWLNNLADLIES